MPALRPIHKLILATAVLFLMPFSILSFHFSSGNTEILRREVLSRIEARAAGTARMAFEILETDYGAREVITGRAFSSASMEERKAMLKKKNKERPNFYLGFSLLNSSGREVASAGREKSDSPDYSRKGVFKRTMASAQSQGAVEYRPDEPPVLLAAEPIRRPGEAKPSGVVVTRISLARLVELVRSERAGSDPGECGIVDAGGLVIADSRGEAVMNPGSSAPAGIIRLINAALARGVREMKAGVSSGKGRADLVSVAAVPGTQWWVYEREPASVVKGYVSSRWARRVIISGMLLILIFSLITARLAVYWLVPRH
ncbi:MAG: cache domain-containing protein [bacterium]